MIDPSEFDTMINWAFVVATVIYALIGYAGYLMYGSGVSDEVRGLKSVSNPLYDCFIDQYRYLEHTGFQSTSKSGCSLDARTQPIVSPVSISFCVRECSLYQVEICA
jgi:hypothetical protein